MNILLVEDEVRIAETLKFGLAEYGFETRIALNGNEGWDIFREGQFDLVILDINLPGLNGHELCKLIRNLNPQIPVIMLTALNAIEDKAEGYDAGADDYLVKPFEFRELLMKIRALVRRTKQQHFIPGNILKASDLVMNLDSREVSRNGIPISLTAKEFQLLEYLIRNKNKVLSRADIAINVWEIDFETNTNVIDVYINYIRNKVDKPFNYKLIQTQIGMGYVLKENQ